MGFNLLNQNFGSVKILEVDLQPGDLPLNSLNLNIVPGLYYFFGGYVITQGGTVPNSVGSFAVTGVTSGVNFLRCAVGGVLGLNVFYHFILPSAQVYTPQVPETYDLTWNYLAGDQPTKFIILYAEY
jgi:hypothetical protein